MTFYFFQYGCSDISVLGMPKNCWGVSPSILIFRYFYIHINLFLYLKIIICLAEWPSPALLTSQIHDIGTSVQSQGKIWCWQSSGMYQEIIIFLHQNFAILDWQFFRNASKKNLKRDFYHFLGVVSGCKFLLEFLAFLRAKKTFFSKSAHKMV